MIELWRGSVNAWECDELGHFNVRFYLAKASEAVANLAGAAGLNPVTRPDASATLIPRDIHIRFLAEARPGAPLYIEGGFLGFDETRARALLVMRHAGSERPAASFRIELGHAGSKEGHDFPWPARFARHAEALAVDAPDFAAPRGVSMEATPRQASEREADARRLAAIGRGRFGPEEMDAFGRLRPEFLLGRVSDSVTNFSAAFPEDTGVHRAASEGRETAGPRIASALLECRIRPWRWPRAGDGFVIRSGLRSAGPKVRNIVHWVLDPTSGQPWWTMEGVAAPMDLDARKLAVVAPETLAALETAADGTLAC